MQIRNTRMLAVGAVLFSIINIWWIYIYRLTGIRFDFAFDPAVFVRVIQENASTLIPLVLATGFLMALGISFIRFFSRYLSKDENKIAIAAGVLIPVAVCFSFFTNWLMFVVIMLFFMAGCMLFVKEQQGDGIMPKLSGGFNDSKNIMSAMAIGAMVVSFMFVMTNLEESQDKFKAALISLQEDINLKNIITREDVRDMVMSSGQILTKDQIKEQLINQTATQAGSSIASITSDPNLMVQIENRTDYIYDMQMEQLDKTIEDNYARMTNASTTRPFMEKFFNQPPFKYIFDFIPVLVPLIVASFVSLFGMMWVAPMGSVMGAFLPGKPMPPQPPKPPQAKK